MPMRRIMSDEWTDRVSRLRTRFIGNPAEGKVLQLADATGEVIGRVEYHPGGPAPAYFIDEPAVERATIAQGRAA